MNTYKSFLVQRFQVGEAAVIIIDTSVCEKAKGGLWGFLTTNAGQNACIGESQFKIIEEYLNEVEDGQRIVIAGHFPLADLKRGERKRLLNMVSDREGWVYMSAHSHYPTDQFQWGNGIEINIASTTDWPMEATNVWFNESGSLPIVRRVKNEVSLLDVADFTKHKGKSEACRHLATAKKLADLIPLDNFVWNSQKPDQNCEPKNADDWEAVGKALSSQVETIKKRFRSEPKFKLAVLRIISAASKSEYDSRDIVELIP